MAYRWLALLYVLPILGLLLFTGYADGRPEAGCNQVVVTPITGEGGRVSWSPDGRLLAIDRRGDDGYSDVYLMEPDGTDRGCLTCGLFDVHVGNPEWHPSGDYIVFTVSRWGFPSGIGVGKELWLIAADGSGLWPLTDAPAFVSHPHFSPDGSLLVWGGLRLGMADFALTPVPHLENVRHSRPGDGRFYEPHSFAGGSLLFTGLLEPEQPSWGTDIYTLDLSSGAVRNLTNARDQWDEHSQSSPSGQKIVWASSNDCGCDPSDLRDLTLDLWMMDADGSNKFRLTHLSEFGYPERMGSHVVPGDISWSPDGTRLAVRLMVGVAEWVAIVDFGEAQ